MKVICAVCNMEGILEIRGKSKRVLHYKGYINGKRTYEKHAILGVNGSKSVGVKALRLAPNSKSVAGPMGFEPMTFGLEG